MATFVDAEAPDYIPDLSFVLVPGTEYWVSENPSTLEDLWAVYYGRDGLVDGLSYDDAERLLDRLYLSTGIPARIARESDYLTAREAGVVAAPTENDSFLLSGRWLVYESDGTCTILDSMAILWIKCERMLIERGMKGKENRFYITLTYSPR